MERNFSFKAKTGASKKFMRSTQISRSLNRVLTLLLAFLFMLSTVAMVFPYAAEYGEDTTTDYLAAETQYELAGEPMPENISALGAGSIDITADFECANFEAAVRELIGKTDGEPIYRSDVDWIKVLAEFWRSYRYDPVTGEWVIVQACLILKENTTSLAGLQHFTALTRLELFHIQLKTLDVSNNRNLAYLHFSNGQLQMSALDLSNNEALTSLWLGWTPLTSLDVSTNKSLTSLMVASPELTTLDVRNNEALTSLIVQGTQLMSLDVGSNRALTSLSVRSNQLTSLDVSNNTELRELIVENNNLTSLDVTALKYLEVLNVDGGLGDVFFYYHEQQFKDYWFSPNQLTTLDVSKNPALRLLGVFGNSLASLDLSSNIKLEALVVGNNLLETIDVSNNTFLTYIHVGGNMLTTIDVSNNPELWLLIVWSNFMDSETSIIGLEHTLIPYWLNHLAGGGAMGTYPLHFYPQRLRVEQPGNTQPEKPQWQPPTPPAQLFPDSRNHWAAAPIGWAYANRITMGTSPTSFSPNRGVTRAEFVTFLHRMAGTPAITGTNPFRDVSSNAWFAGTVTWASTSGITAGTSPTTFHPNRAITREEMTVMLFRFIRDIVESDNLASPAAALDRFPDRGQVSGWAQDSVRWAADQEIIGVGGRLNPRGNATRAEAVTMLYRLVDRFNVSAP